MVNFYEAKSGVVRIRNFCGDLFEDYEKKYVGNKGTCWKGKSTASALNLYDSTSNKPTWERILSL